MTSENSKKMTRRQFAAKTSLLAGGLSALPNLIAANESSHNQKNQSAINNTLTSPLNHKGFIDDNFLLHNKTAEILYHEYAKNLPIIDYHCHLSPREISSNKQFENLTQIWLAGDHYKMRAMRANGVDEKFITGDANDYDKFMKWAETIPYTIRNPLFHWTHLELLRYFNINTVLNQLTAKEIYDKATSLLNTEDYRVQNLILKQNVEIICTTDDPVDTLQDHKNILSQKFPVKVFPTWRPDKILAAEDLDKYNHYLDSLSEISNEPIISYQNLIDAFSKRQKYFHSLGCKLSDHGLEQFFFEPYTHAVIKKIFNKIRAKKTISKVELLQFKTATLVQLCEMNQELGWVQQFHVGALRNNNTFMYNKLGADKGFDSIGDFEMGKSMSRFFDCLAQKQKLAKTIVYNLNPRDNELFVTMIGNYNDGSFPGKMQYGSAWWFLDQKDGIEKQINALSNHGLLGRFVGMLTDSRSFLSFPRHEYFRRILCNIIGKDVESNELPYDLQWLGKIIENVCYYNAKEYFNFK
jgi:glucuronate isomerase